MVNQMWTRTGLALTIRNSISDQLPSNNLFSLGSKYWLQGYWNSWSHYIPIANKSSGRTVRDPVNVYFPGDQIPSSRKRNKITSYKDSSNTSGNYIDQADQRGLTETRFNSSSTSTAIKPSPGSNLFHESMSDALNVRQRKFICLEGQRLVEEGFKAGLEIHKLFLRKTIKEVPSRLAKFVEQGNVPVHHVSDTAIKNWSTLTTPPGIVGIFRKPKEKDIGAKSGLTKGMPVTVICDNVREPGNLGSILRSAAGAGCERVLLSKGCCDPWDSKVLRSGCGAQFYMPVYTDFSLSSLLDNIQGDSVCHDTDEEAIDHGNAAGSFSEIGVGSESNLARDEKSSPSFALLLADSNDTLTDERQPLSVVSYTDADYRTFRKIYLVVGGETEGLSPEILRIAANVKTHIHPQILHSTVARLRIPLLHNMESLNSSNAFSIIIYEILRQFRPGRK